MFNWTPNYCDQAKTLWLQGFTAERISQIIGHGLTRNAVIGKIHRMGLSHRKLPESPKKLLKPKIQKPSAPIIHKRSISISVIDDSIVYPPGPRPWETRRKGECNWPLDQKCGVGFLYCCDPTAPNGQDQYCLKHRLKAYYPKQKKSVG